ncbi:MAG: phosphoglycerate kinase, partial [Dehalococcoidales bacterium]|nr:phosphoglycerate kinase [Dehalococcoidales bacterium]
MNKMTVRDIEVAGKRVLVRVDFNVPVDDRTGEITDDSRIRAALPTINYLIQKGARIILMSHQGRPKGRVVEEYRLAPIARRLSEMLGKPVAVTDDCIGPDAERAAAALKAGDVLMLENLRFHPGEEKGDEEFARALARLGDVYVNDAFGTAHRAHASISVIARYLPAVSGFLLEKEINTLGGLLESPAHPFVAILGGAKVSDKVTLINNIMGKVDCLLIGGGMAATFLKAQSVAVGTSPVEEDCVDVAGELMNKAVKSNVTILLPTDVIVTDDINRDAEATVVPVGEIPADRKIADIGPRTTEAFSREIRKSRTVFWNGPVGVEEIPQFANGTRALANLLAEIDATTLVGGGSTAEVMDSLGL